jgi:hypothetical protein
MKLVFQYQADPVLKEILLGWTNSVEGRGLSLESFLIKPVQRICKYPLLLRVHIINIGISQSLRESKQ